MKVGAWFQVWERGECVNCRGPVQEVSNAGLMPASLVQRLDLVIVKTDDPEIVPDEVGSYGCTDCL